MIRTILILSLLFLTNGLCSQVNQDAVDKYNEKHKKTGLWTVYLDEYTNKVDKSKAVFIGYELFDNGACLIPFSKYRAKKYKVEFDGEKGVPGHPIMLNGTHKLLYKSSGKVSYEGTYKNGRPVVLKAYRYDREGICKMKEILDFGNQYNHIDGTFYYQIFGYDEQPALKGYYQKGKKGWYVPVK